MNKDISAGKWAQLQSEVRLQWGQLTADELEEINGRYEKMVEKLEEVYGYNRKEAAKEVEAFFSKHR